MHTKAPQNWQFSPQNYPFPFQNPQKSPSFLNFTQNPSFPPNFLLQSTLYPKNPPKFPNFTQNSTFSTLNSHLHQGISVFTLKFPISPQNLQKSPFPKLFQNPQFCKHFRQQSTLLHKNPPKIANFTQNFPFFHYISPKMAYLHTEAHQNSKFLAQNYLFPLQNLKIPIFP